MDEFVECSVWTENDCQEFDMLETPMENLTVIVNSSQEIQELLHDFLVDCKEYLNTVSAHNQQTADLIESLKLTISLCTVSKKVV